MKKLPNFVVIGAGKSGTSSLYEYLSEHPEVFMSPVKETNFFALEGQDMVDPKDDPDQLYHYPWSVTNQEDYEALFDDAGDAKAIGEVSPMYMYSRKAAYQIKKTIPDAKIIAILRNPVDRLYSRYMHLVREHREPTKNFEDSLDRKSIWWRRKDLVPEGFYHSHLSHYYEIFDKEQIRVYLYDDFRKKQKEVIRDIYEFIGVEPDFNPDISTEYNVSGRIKNKALDSLIGQRSILKATIQKISPSLGAWVKKQTGLKKWINQIRNKNLEKQPLSMDTRLRLIQQVYQQEIVKLQSLLGKDLSAWLGTNKTS